MRTFIGIDFDDELKKNIFELQQRLRELAVKGRWKHSDNFHLTLKFLDEIDEKQKMEIDNALRQISCETKPFELSLSGLGIFPGGDSVRVLWLGVTGDMPELKYLQGSIDQALEPIGFPKDKRAYRPHITIGQDVVFKLEFDEIKKIIGEVKLTAFKVNRLFLFKSEQIGYKRVYTKIEEYKLGGERK